MKLKNVTVILRKNLLFELVLVGILLLYLPILFKYFEQDEWHNYGVMIFRQHEGGLLGLITNIFQSSLPAIQTYNTFNFLLFGVNNWFPAITVLALVAVNAVIWYKIVQTITTKKSVALFSVIFGYINLLSYQSVAWVLPAVASQLSFLFLNLSLLFFIQYLKDSTKKNLVTLLLFAILATLSKQNSMFLFLFYPVIYLLFKRNEYARQKIVKLAAAIGSLIIISGVAYWYKLGGVKFGEGRVTEDWIQLFLNVIFLPLKSMSQLIFPFPDHFYNFTRYLTSVRYGSDFGDAISQGLMIELISVIGSLILIIGVLIVGKIFKKVDRKGMLFFGLFYLLSFLPFAIDKYSTGTGYSESRYYQLAVISLGVLVGIVVFRITSILWSRKSYLSKVLLVILVFFFLLSFTYQVKKIQDGLHMSVEVTQKRKEILDFISSNVDRNSNKLIIYTENINHTGADNITGEYFQTGILYPFLVYTHQNDYVSPMFFSNDMLWDFTYQGVTESNGKIVGIFYNFEELQAFMKVNPSYIKYLHSFRFDYSEVGRQPSTYNFMDIRLVKYSDITSEVIDELQ